MTPRPRLRGRAEHDSVGCAARLASVMDKGRAVATLARAELLDTERVAGFLAV